MQWVKNPYIAAPQHISLFTPTIPPPPQQFERLLGKDPACFWQRLNRAKPRFQHRATRDREDLDAFGVPLSYTAMVLCTTQMLNSSHASSAHLCNQTWGLGTQCFWSSALSNRLARGATLMASTLGMSCWATREHGLLRSLQESSPTTNHIDIPWDPAENLVEW